ncbi:MAG TPA: family 1 glycosylhydrolase [Candidatus Eisenbacteria bacterium]|nr:family 1 glycosylhydrolase [Candidatus Eisenbacteria bacterium]
MRFAGFFLIGVFFFAAPAGAAAPEKDSRDSDSRFGVLEFLPWDHEWNAHHYAGDKVDRAAVLMREAGVGWVRMDFIWSDVEPEKGRFDFRKYDRIVDVLSAEGVRVLGLLDYNAAFAGGEWNSPPDPKLFANYAREVVRHFKDRVKYWEVWNEPDQAIYWTPQDDMVSYTALLKRVYPAIKAEDPTARVVLGGLSGGAVFPLRNVYKNGGGPFFDIVNVHPFADPLRGDAVATMRGVVRGAQKVMEKNGDSAKPVWITEIGCPGVRPPAKTANWWLGENPDEAAQAAWVEKVYGKSLAWPGVEKVFWAFFRDTPDHFKTGTDYFGLVREDFSKKPAFEAYKKAAKAE